MKEKMKRIVCVLLVTIMLLTSVSVGGVGIEASAANWDVINAKGVTGSDIVTQARKYLGVQYDTSGGNYKYRTGFGNPMMFDCSGFVYRVCRDVGLASSRKNYTMGVTDTSGNPLEGQDSNGNYYITAHTQEQRYYGKDISSSVKKYLDTGDYSELKAGDLLFITNNNSSVSHVAIYSGNGTIVHSEGWQGCVAEHSLDRYHRSKNSSNWYFAGCRLVESNSSSLIQTTYPSYCKIKSTVDSAPVWSMPCSNKTDKNSKKIGSLAKDATTTTYELIKNKEENLWYKIKSKSGTTGYIYAGNTSYVSYKTDITSNGITVPASHTAGKSYVLTGSVSTTYTNLKSVSAYVYKGSATSGTAETGTSASVSSNSYSFSGSTIDNNTKFNVLPAGTHNFVVKAVCSNYYAKSGTTAQGLSITYTVYKNTFNVVSAGSTNTTPQQPTTVLYPTNNGVYKIASAVGSGKYLDFACTSNNVQIYENCDNHSDPAFVKIQYFKLTHMGDGWYTIVNTGNGKAMDVVDANAAPGTNVHQYELNKTNAQLFRFYDAGNGYCYIKSKLGCYIDVNGGTNANNTNVHTYTFNATNAQKWKLQSHTHSYTSKVTANATCTKDGSKVNSCRCGVSYTETIAKKGHSYTSTVTTQPTSTQNGVRTYKCSCGASYTEPIYFTPEMCDHAETYVVEQPATTSQDGKAKGYCNICNKVLRTQVIYQIGTVALAKTECNFSWDSVSPVLIIKDKEGNDLKINVDYKAAYEEKRSLPGKYSIKIDFIGRYSGSEMLYYTILPAKPVITKTSQSVDAVRLTWNKVIGADGYRVYQYNPKTKTWDKIKTLSGTTYRISKLKSGTTYKFRVKAYKKDGETIWGKATSTITVATKPATPVITKTAQSDDSITLTWNKVTGAGGYRVYQYNAETNKYVKLKTLSGTTYQISKSDSVTTYKFKVKAYKKSGGVTLWSSATPEITVTTKPAVPSGVTTVQSTSAINLTWNKTTGADGYRVYMYNDNTKKWINQKTLTATSLTVKNLKPGTTYKFKVIAYKMVNGAAVWGDYTSVITVTTKPAVPSGIKSARNASAIKLEWNKTAGADGYRVYMYNAKTKTYTKLATFTGTSYMVKNLKAGTTYQFKIVAYRKIGNTVVWGDYTPIIKVATRSA